jgi:signal transduction histidine kinase
MDGSTVYQRGEPAPGLDPAWVAGGEVGSSMGSHWLMEHRPTAEAIAKMRSPWQGAILVLGLVIAVLLAALTWETGRARARAAQAESAEQLLAGLNVSLEAAVRERTEELELRNADLQTITDSVAHDLRDPLNAISMNSQLLAMQLAKLDNSQLLAVVERIPPCVERMGGILDRLIGLSAVSHSVFNPEPLDMQALVQEEFDSLNASEPGPPVEFTCEPLPPAEGDRTLVRLLLTNLLSNALKYTRESEPRRVKAGYGEDDGVTFYSIEDNGSGFDTQDADRIFNAFQRLADAREVEGLGLGLTVATRAVHRHGGRLWARGSKGKGAIFCFTLQPGAEDCDA